MVQCAHDTRAGWESERETVTYGFKCGAERYSYQKTDLQGRHLPRSRLYGKYAHEPTCYRISLIGTVSLGSHHARTGDNVLPKHSPLSASHTPRQQAHSRAKSLWHAAPSLPTAGGGEYRLGRAREARGWVSTSPLGRAAAAQSWDDRGRRGREVVQRRWRAPAPWSRSQKAEQCPQLLEAAMWSQRSGAAFEAVTITGGVDPCECHAAAGRAANAGAGGASGPGRSVISKRANRATPNSYRQC